MKIVKYIFLLLLLAAISLTVFIATQDGTYNIQENKTIAASRPVLYNYVSDYKNWANLQLFKGIDSTATYNFSENTAGNGAFITWQKDNNSGRIQTTGAAGNDSLSQKATLNSLDANLSWVFKDTLKNSTRVTIKLKGKLTFTEKAYAFLQGGIDNGMQASLKKGLSNLDAFLVKELKVYTVKVEGRITKKAAFYLGHTATSTITEATQKALPNFDKLLAFAKENKIVVNGAPFILYKNISRQDNTATYTYAIPIKEEMYSTAGSEFEGGSLLAFTALKTTLKGDYSHLPKAWGAAAKYITENNLPENTTGEYIEIYSKSVTQTRRPSAWVTDIYIPLGDQQLQPEIPVDVMNMEVPLPAATKPASGSTTTKPASQASAGTGVKPSTIKPSATKPVGTSSVQPSSGSSTRGTGTSSGGTSTSRPASSGTTQRPSGTTPAARPAPSSTGRPGSTTRTAPATTKPATRTTTSGTTTRQTVTKPGVADDLNPPRGK